MDKFGTIIYLLFGLESGHEALLGLFFRVLSGAIIKGVETLRCWLVDVFLGCQEVTIT